MSKTISFFMITMMLTSASISFAAQSNLESIQEKDRRDAVQIILTTGQAAQGSKK